jgi:hypothetical protein
MTNQHRTHLVGGVILLLVGLFLLAVQIFPSLGVAINIEFSWPLIVIGVGLLLFIFGLLVNAPDMAVPACIVGGIGGLLYWQNATGRWDSWAYAWTLIPGFVGVGVILAGLLKGEFRQGLRDGGTLIIISLIMFAIFASFLGGMSTLGDYWPLLLVLLGGWLLLRGVFLRKK